MQGDFSPYTLQYIPEIEKFCRANRKQARKKKQQNTQHQAVNQEVERAETLNFADMDQHQHNMNANGNGNGAGNGNRRTLGDYTNGLVNQNQSSIVRPPVACNNFEIKPALLQYIGQNQFAGNEVEDPNIHIQFFMEVCDMVKINGASEDAIKLRLFPFSLRDKAKSWLLSQPRGSITTWEELEARFLARFFPASRFIKTRAEANCFSQKEGETLYEAWERFKELLRRCPNHGFDDLTQMQTFYNGLRPATKLILDASAGGTMNTKTPEEAQALVEAMASNDYQMMHDRAYVPQKKGVLELDSSTAILAQNKLITQQLEALTKQIQSVTLSQPQVQPQVQQVMSCDFCGGDHENGNCEASTSPPEEVNFMGRQGGNQFSNNNFPSKGSQNTTWRQDGQMQNRPPFQPLHERTTILENTMAQFIQVSQTNYKNHEASIKNLENQIGQLAKQLTEQSNGQFSGVTQVNPKDQMSS